MKLNKFIRHYIEEKVKDKKNIEIIGLTKRESKNVIRLLEEEEKQVKDLFKLLIVSYLIALAFGITCIILVLL